MTVLLGPPGVGKTTQARLLADRSGAVAVSIGELLRYSLTGPARDVIDRGAFVEDSTVERLLQNHISATPGALILDGFPRTFDQAALLRTIRDRLLHPNVVVLSSADEVLRRRLDGRKRSDDRRDDVAPAIAARLARFRAHLPGVLEGCRAVGLDIWHVDGGPTADVVQAEIAALGHES